MLAGVPTLAFVCHLFLGSAGAPVMAEVTVAADTDPEAHRRRELDDLRREDVAAQLALLGVATRWQEHPLAELIDWRDRIEAAVTLRVQHHVNVDWRMTSLRDLLDMRLRAAKAAELAKDYGIHVDWQRMSWSAMEKIRRGQASLDRATRSTAAAKAAVSRPDPDGLATPDFSRKSQRFNEQRFAGPSKDPDAIIEPTFALNASLLWSRPADRKGKPDPDAIMVPRFGGMATPPPGRDDVLAPWNQAQ